MSINIHLSSETPDAELQAIQALIVVLRNCNDAPLHLRNTTDENSALVQQAVVPGEFASSVASGAVSQPSISVTVPPAPVATQAGEPTLVTNMDGYPVPLPPSAVPVPPAPVAVVPPPPVSSGAAVALDAEGLPWDARIHSSSRGRTAKDCWARRRNTPYETWEAVRAELRQVMAAPAAVPVAPVETYVVEQPVIDAATAFAPPVATVPVAVPVPPTPPAPVATAPAMPDVTGVTDLLVRITGAQAAGTVSVDQVQAAVTLCGLTSLRDLMNRPDLVPTVSAAVFGAGQ